MASSPTQTTRDDPRVVIVALAMARAAAREDCDEEPAYLNTVEEAGRDYYMMLARAALEALA